MALNHCRNSGTTASGGAMGGMARSNYNKVTCPTCGKRVQVTKDGRLWPHGTRPAPTERPCDHCTLPLHRDENGWWVGKDGMADCSVNPRGHQVEGQFA